LPQRRIAGSPDCPDESSRQAHIPSFTRYASPVACSGAADVFLTAPYRAGTATAFRRSDGAPSPMLAHVDACWISRAFTKWLMLPQVNSIDGKPARKDHSVNEIA
jgi:hypothetical protein